MDASSAAAKETSSFLPRRGRIRANADRGSGKSLVAAFEGNGGGVIGRAEELGSDRSRTQHAADARVFTRRDRRPAALVLESRGVLSIAPALPSSGETGVAAGQADRGFTTTSPPFAA